MRKPELIPILSKNFFCRDAILSVKAGLPKTFDCKRAYNGPYNKVIIIIILHQKIRREISAGVFKAIFDLQPHLVVDILNFESFVTRVTDMDATVK